MILTIWTKADSMAVCQLSDDPKDGTAQEQIEQIGSAGFSGWTCVSSNYSGTFPETDAALWRWDGEKVYSLPAPVPQTVTRRQARRALQQFSLLAGIDDAINAIDDPQLREQVRIDWEDATEFHRNDQTLLTLAARLGLDDYQLDQLFYVASQL